MIRPRSVSIIPATFGGSGSIVQYEPGTDQVLTAQTTYVQGRVPAAGAAVRIAYSNCNSGSVNGVRFQINTSGLLGFGADSTGFAGAPLKVSGTVPTVGEWLNVAATWDGVSLTGADIQLYWSINGDPITLDNPGGTTDGSGTLNPPTGQPFCIGNRTGGARPWASDISQVARWGRILSYEEIKQVQKYGVLSVPNQLVFFGVAGPTRVFRDFGPFRKVPTIVSDVVRGGQSIYNSPVPPRMLTSYSFGVSTTPPTAGQNRSYFGVIG